MTATELRQKYPTFHYRSAKWQVTNNQLVAQFQYNANGSLFQHQISFPIKTNVANNLDSIVIDQLVFSLGMIESFSYWKAFCSPLLMVEAEPLSAWQIEWWHTVLIEGMGEYFYVNQIDFTAPDFVKIKPSVETTQNPKQVVTEQTQLNQESSATIAQQSPHHMLIPLGGGKDSIVTVELLKQYQAENSQVDLAILMVNPTDAARAVATHSQLSTLTVTRTLDPLLLDLNARGFLNGHVPFSASLAFISTLAAYLNQFDAIAVSNEASANEASLTYLNRPINHQYSKSFAFEQHFAQYIKFLTNQCNQQVFDPNMPTQPASPSQHSLPTYFSLLRPLTELQITRLFAQLGQPYFPLFRSCNRGSKTNIWCGQCAKCLFTYLMLSPFLDQATVVSIFGQNLLDNASLLPTLHALIGTSPDKPLDCVGLRQESLVACYLTLQRFNKTDQPLPYLVSAIKTELMTELNLNQEAQALLKAWNPQHLVPKDLEKLLQSKLR